MMNEVFRHIKKQYFWDVDVSKLDLKASRRLIIERIFSLGDIEDMQALISYYGKKEIIDVLCGLNYLDPKTLNFVAKLFNKPKEEFRCYIRRQSSLGHR